MRRPGNGTNGPNGPNMGGGGERGRGLWGVLAQVPGPEGSGGGGGQVPGGSRAGLGELKAVFPELPPGECCQLVLGWQ